MLEFVGLLKQPQPCDPKDRENGTLGGQHCWGGNNVLVQLGDEWSTQTGVASLLLQF